MNRFEVNLIQRTITQAALEALPNGVLPSVAVTRGGSVFRVTFNNAANAGEQRLLECNPPDLVNLCESGCVWFFFGLSFSRTRAAHSC